ncbi:unnamed protein product [Discula destructiva]
MNLNLRNPLVNKARRPKFEVHLKIYDLNNVPLAHGASHIKWHLPHSIHSEHRGRTPKCPIAHHRVEYNYNKLIPVRMAIDKNNALSECLVEFEIIQEFRAPTTNHQAGGATASTNGGGGGGREERITLGRLTLNLAEYVEESEAIMRENHGFRATRMGSASATAAAAAAAAQTTTTTTTSTQEQQQQSHTRNPSESSSSMKRPSLDSGSKPRPSTPPQPKQQGPSASDPLVEEGIVRRYLLTDAKINSTLKISILVHQLDGERAFIAPPLKTAGAVFGGGILPRPGGAGGEDLSQHFQDTHPEQDSANLSAAFHSGEDAAAAAGANSNNRDAAAARHEVQDLYRRALAASWACQPGELPADECIEDIFNGGDGGDVTPRVGTPRNDHRKMMFRREDSGSSSTGEANDFLRPGGALKRGGAGGGSGRRRNHVRHGSGESMNTLRTNADGRPGSSGGTSMMSTSGVSGTHQRPGHRRDGSKDSSLRGIAGGGGGGGGGGRLVRRDSLASLAGSTMESERSRSGFKSAREVTEREIREDFVAWTLPGTA